MLYRKGGNLPFEVVGEVPQTRPDADIVFFDHQASDWEVPQNKLLLMPLQPKRDQYATYVDALKRARAAGREVITVVTNGQIQRPGERKTTEALALQGAFVIPSSGVFSRAADEYRTIFDQALNKAYKIGERRREVSQILGALLLEQTNNEGVVNVAAA